MSLAKQFAMIDLLSVKVRLGFIARSFSALCRCRDRDGRGQGCSKEDEEDENESDPGQTNGQ